ncbi:MAG: cbb3-type cytochrome oxidase assembly protein CcoS [Bacteroidetes bacterium]|nr:cbb3-type cytochrome oxidase assembly protein CcoS [Bacteroidota bacterium]
MNVLYVLVPLALLLAAVGVTAFVWSVRSGQFEDVETPGLRVLFDEETSASDQAESREDQSLNSD